MFSCRPKHVSKTSLDLYMVTLFDDIGKFQASQEPLSGEPVGLTMQLSLLKSRLLHFKNNHWDMTMNSLNFTSNKVFFSNI